MPYSAGNAMTFRSGFIHWDSMRYVALLPFLGWAALGFVIDGGAGAGPWRVADGRADQCRRAADVRSCARPGPACLARMGGGRCLSAVRRLPRRHVAVASSSGPTPRREPRRDRAGRDRRPHARRQGHRHRRGDLPRSALRRRRPRARRAACRHASGRVRRPVDLSGVWRPSSPGAHPAGPRRPRGDPTDRATRWSRAS